MYPALFLLTVRRVRRLAPVMHGRRGRALLRIAVLLGAQAKSDGERVRHTDLAVRFKARPRTCYPASRTQRHHVEPRQLAAFDFDEPQQADAVAAVIVPR